MDEPLPLEIQELQRRILQAAQILVNQPCKIEFGYIGTTLGHHPRYRWAASVSLSSGEKTVCGATGTNNEEAHDNLLRDLHSDILTEELDLAREQAELTTRLAEIEARQAAFAKFQLDAGA